MNQELMNKSASDVAVQGQNRRGFEEQSGQEDLIIPRAKLLQALSPEIVDREEGLDTGMIINSLTKDPLPEVFVPVFRFVNWVRFNPRDKKAPGFDQGYEPGAVIWRSEDPHDQRVIAEGAWGEDGTPPLATKFMNFLSYFPGVPMPIIVSFSKTSYKTGKELNSLATFRGGDMFAYQYKLTSKQESGDSGTYYVLKVKDAGEVSGEDYKQAEKFYNDLKGKTKDIKVHDEGTDEEWKE